MVMIIFQNTFEITLGTSVPGEKGNKNRGGKLRREWERKLFLLPLFSETLVQSVIREVIKICSLANKPL